ncbi:MAG: hypothetical protein WBQ05_07310 [Candidatus Competibacter denitrificans]
MENIPSLETVATLVEQAAQHFHRLFEYLAYLVGFLFVAKGCYLLYGTTQDRQRSRWSALTYVIAGVSLVYLNKWYQAASLTFLGIDETLMYSATTTNWSTLMLGACLTIVQFLGFVALMRSWFLFRLVGSGELSQFAVSRAVVFFVAGVLALNINQTVRVVFATLGTTSPLG